MEQNALHFATALVVGRSNKVDTTVGIKRLLIVVKEGISLPIHGDTLVNISAPSRQIEGVQVP